ncbi:MAG: phosphotransferase [Candidatus Zixiibacteriota bacterium]|nr:MAG: phosphotransferase [candidate division Zixibacteria bacterium]
MKAFQEITHLGRLRRFRKLAHQALKAYRLSDADVTFLTYEGNVMYRVDSTSRTRSDDLYYPGRYLLRIHMDYHSTAAIESELKWLSAMRRDADLPVPEPILSADGKPVIELLLPGTDDARRKCSILRWVDGRFVSRRLGQRHVLAWGELMARLHNHAAQWKLPKGFIRPRRDWNGLFADAARFEHPAYDLWEAIPAKYKDAFEVVTSRLKSLMKRLGQGSDVFGLVHADLMISTNILFKRGKARVIDFDDCCFAYWMHDLAFALSSWQGNAREPWIRDTFLEGYSRVRHLPQSQLKHLDLFLAAFNANLMLWMLDWAMLNPISPEPRRFVDKYGRNLLRYLSR